MAVPESELETHLKEQIGFLVSSCEIYDDGKREEAKRIAAHLRILFHNTGMSKSLLRQLGLDSMHYINTAEPYDPNNLVSTVSLVIFKFNNSAGRRAWMAPRGNPPRLPQKAHLGFLDWWNMPVIVARGKIKDIIFSRKDLVLYVANTDGGSHVDSMLDETYMAISRWNAIGITTIQNGIEKPIDNPVFPCIRQIAHEVLTTLQERLPKYFEKPYSDKNLHLPSPDNPGTGTPTRCGLSFHVID